MKDFDELFNNSELNTETNNFNHKSKKGYFNFCFNSWLKETGKSWKNEKEYQNHLSKKNWLLFIQDHNKKKFDLAVKALQEKASWKLENFHPEDLEKAVKLTGYGNQNTEISRSINFYFIEDYLKELHLTPLEAKKIISRVMGAFSPKFKEKVLPEIFSFLDNLSKESKPLNKANQSNQKKTSFLWQNNPDKELPELFSLMIDKYKLIASETTYEQFKQVFTGQPTESINPIKWKATNRLLAYFLDNAFNGQNWQSMAGNGNLFLNKSGKQINANDLSVAKRNYTEFGEPNGYKEIDLILKTIKKHSEH
jgi:hypothetical protein